MCEWKIESSSNYFTMRLINGAEVSQDNATKLPLTDRKGKDDGYYLGVESIAPDETSGIALTTLKSQRISKDEHRATCLKFWYTHGYETKLKAMVETVPHSMERYDTVWSLINPTRPVPEGNQRWNDYEWAQAQVRVEEFYGEDYQVQTSLALISKLRTSATISCYISRFSLILMMKQFIFLHRYS